jgi:SNF2 family DNA or RNA helicase
MAETVKLNVDDNSLTVELPAKSPFLSGQHRVYLVNVMGLQPSETILGYVIQRAKTNTTDIIVELVEYFKSEGAVVSFNNEVRGIVDTFEEGSENFEDAKVLGQKLKRKPPKTISVPNFKRTLKPYQVAPVAHLIEVGNSANFSVPGSGKTTITLAGYSILKKQGAVEKILVICPRAAFMSWEEEYKGCFGKAPKSIRLSGAVSIRKALYRQAANAELILLTYQMASQDVNRLSVFLRENKVMLVLDESHNIKRIAGGKWSSTVLSLAPFAARRVILSGTPVPNSLEDLWSQMTFLWPNPKILGSAEEYRDRIATLGVNAAEDIKRHLSPFYWRLHKSQLKLKRPKFHFVSVKMRPYQKAIYDTVAVRILNELVKMPEERVRLRAWRKAKMIRLLQIASNPALLNRRSDEFDIPPMDGSGLPVSELIEKYPAYETPPKIAAIVELAESLMKKKEKVIIWTTFIHNIKTLEKLLKKYEPRVIYGDVPKDVSENEAFNREKMIREFKETKQYNILLANPGACAESISLHKVCHHAIYLDRTFNCSQYLQSLDRIHRIGLGPDEQVHYYIFQVKNSIDEVINERLKEKQKQMLTLLDDDFALLDLENSEVFSEESEEEEDFNAMIKNLRKNYE